MIPEDEKAEYIKLAEIAFSDKSLNMALMDSLPYAAMLIHKDRVVLAANSGAKEIGVVEMTNCWDTFGKLASIPPEDREYFEKHGKAPESGTKCHFCRGDEALKKQELVVEDVEAGGKVWETHWVPVGRKIYLHYAVDVTDKRGNA